MTLIVRAATFDDVVQLHALVREHAAFERNAASLTVSDLEVIVAGDDPPIRLLISEREGVLLVYAAVTFDWSLSRARRYGHLDCLFVAEDARGKGVGAKLLDEVARLASAEGADRLEWQTPAWNEDALRFYLRHGAESADKKRLVLTIEQLA